MVFSSILFLFRFLPVAFAAYYLAPKRLKNFVLLVVSLVFYSWGEAKYFPVMISCILVNYISAILIDKYRDNVRIRPDGAGFSPASSISGRWASSSTPTSSSGI